MRFFFYIGIGLALITLQTALLPRLAFIGTFFDLLLPLVIFLAVLRPLPESLPLIFFLGLLTDSLSGGPFGLYLTAYVWLGIGVRLASGVVRADNPILFVLLLAACVLLQNFFFIAVLAHLAPVPSPAGEALQVMGEQIGWVLLAGPFLAVLVRRAGRLQARLARRVDPLQDRNGAG